MSENISAEGFLGLFAPEQTQSLEANQSNKKASWKVLLVDDEADIHAVLKLALQTMEIEGRSLEFFDANSEEQAKSVLAEHPDMALILLDVVMESEQAGLSLVHYVRKELANQIVQIVLVTGQPGYAPQREVVVDYEINGYRLKSELTADKIFTLVSTALRTYQVMLELEKQRTQFRAQTEILTAQQAILDRWRCVFEHAEWGVVVCSADGQLVELANPAFVRQHGYSKENIVGMPIIDLFAPEEQENCLSQIQKAHESDHHTFESKHIRNDGSIFPVLVNYATVKDGCGQVLYGVANVQDVSDIKLAEEKIHLAASVFAYAHEGIMITSTDGKIIEVNNAFSQITGYSRDEAIGRNPRFLNSGHQDKDFYTAMWRDLLDKGHWYGEIWNRRKNGEVFAEMLTISSIYDSQGNILQYVALFSDISSLKEHERDLEHIAHYDALTCLPNRVLLADRLRQGLAHANRHQQSLAVVYLDLDGFKAINDKYGHETGDQVLVVVASRMKQSLREDDTLARLGGDEFVVVLPDLANLRASEPMLARLLAAAAQPVQVGNLLMQVTASIGVTIYPQAEDLDADQLLRQADHAMYQAKLAGKNRYYLYDAEQDNSLRSLHESTERIRLALIGREFVLYYQPKVNMRTGAVIGVEALIRWQHPEKGLLAPAFFLPMIEDHPLVIDIGDWVIDTALTQMERWQATGLEIAVSVNVAARQLQQSDFVDRLRNLLIQHSTISPSLLSIEILETSALEDLKQVSKIIEDCRLMGVMFALDDFGTGYSSLTYLKQLPVNLIKLDQSFVRDMLDNPDDLAIIEGVVELAHTFRREVIAEGVETVEHGTMLLKLGCEFAQGYGIARPMAGSQLHSWLTSWQPDPAWVEQSAISRDDLLLLFASVEQRSWIAAIEAFLKGDRDAPLALDKDQSRFSIWMTTEGRVIHSTHPSIATIDALHRQIHTLSTELCELKILGRNADALARLEEFHDLGDALIEQLKVPPHKIKY